MAPTAFEPKDMPAFEPETKIGLLATVNPAGEPHLTLITAMQAKTPTEIVWGQFTEGSSKAHVRENPRVGFLIMTMDRRVWRGKAVYRRAVGEGDDYQMFNNKPMFRYNSYFGIHTVHYMDLLETTAGEKLPLGAIVPAALLTSAGRLFAGDRHRERVLKPWAESTFNKLDTLKFLAFIDADGFPAIVPLLQCQAADSGRLVFSPLAYGADLRRVPVGAKVAVFALTMKMEDVLTRGSFLGYVRRPAIRVGAIDIDWVYNSMPPCHGQIYPAVPLPPVADF